MNAVLISSAAVSFLGAPRVVKSNCVTVQEAGPKPAADEKVFFTPTTAYVSDEWGLDRCDRITSPSLTAANEYWTKAGAYWAAVRRVWADTFAQHDRVALRRDVDGRKLFEEHFAYAEKLEDGAPCDPANAERHARETIVRFLTSKSPCPGTSLPPTSAPASPTRRATRQVF